MISNFTSAALGGKKGIYSDRETHTSLMDGWEQSDFYKNWCDKAREAGSDDTLAYLTEQIVDSGEHFSDHQYELTQECGSWHSASVCMRIDVEVHHGKKGNVGAVQAIASEIEIKEGSTEKGTYVKLVMQCTNTEHKKHRRRTTQAQAE